MANQRQLALHGLTLAITLSMHVCGNNGERRRAVHNATKASTSSGEQGAAWRGIFGKSEGKIGVHPV